MRRQFVSSDRQSKRRKLSERPLRSGTDPRNRGRLTTRSRIKRHRFSDVRTLSIIDGCNLTCGHLGFSTEWLYAANYRTIFLSFHRGSFVASHLLRISKIIDVCLCFSCSVTDTMQTISKGLPHIRNRACFLELQWRKPQGVYSLRRPQEGVGNLIEDEHPNESDGEPLD